MRSEQERFEEMTRDELLKNTLLRLDEICPRGIYTFMEEQLPQLNREFNQVEQRIDKCFIFYRSIDELKAALKDYWNMHMRVAEKMKNMTNIQD